ncbi:MAG: 3-deoxy-manno-octulosonate cytidylyltransferase [Bacteroidales bacterium]|nr:MAG: 3-deoxy-manno-octulosonate cytidylyltransferase [Bacteroidales bacterium]
MIHFLGIIPARFHSSRFPGKPLADIGGKPMIRRVYEQASKVLDRIVVATDDERIAREVRNFNGIAVLTSPEHKTGTDRCAEALEHILEDGKGKADVVINIQGDEPFIHPSQIQDLMSSFTSPEIQIATLAKTIDSGDELFDPNIPKVVINRKGEALYFSRSPIPHIQNMDQSSWTSVHTFYKHIGIYAYRAAVLRELTGLKASKLELAESLEQNRWLENGYRIKVSITEHESISVDTPEDLEKIRKLGFT